MASSIAEVRISDLPEIRHVIEAYTAFAEAARPLFDPHGPVTGSPEWQSAWAKSEVSLAALLSIKATFPKPIEAPAAGTPRMCIICACEKPWGVFDSKTGAAACIDCRDKSRSADGLLE